MTTDWAKRMNVTFMLQSRINDAVGMAMNWVAAGEVARASEIQCVRNAVGSARRKYGIGGSATIGNSDFERCFRVHQNALEQLIVFP